MGKSIISNSSSLIFIGKLDIFNLVRNVYSEVLVPKEVAQEIFKYDKIENLLIKREEKIGFIKIVKVEKIKDLPIHVGEKAAVSLCLEKNVSLFLSDDKRARRCARSFGVSSLGVIGIILENYKLKYISKEEVRILIRRLIDCGFYMSVGLYERIIRIIDR